jgi:hypothetical protein
MSTKYLLIVDRDMDVETRNNIVYCKQEMVTLVEMSLSNIHECCGTIHGLTANGQSFHNVGIVSHKLQDITTLIDPRFMDGLRRLFPVVEDIFACTLDINNPVLRIYSHDLGVPIYFSTNKTGSTIQGDQDWLMENRIQRGVCRRYYLVQKTINTHSFMVLSQ